MLPSKISPTISARAFTTGEPELPPMMSFVVAKSNGVREVEPVLRLEPARGQGERVAPGGALERAREVVKGGTSRVPSRQPFTWP